MHGENVWGNFDHASMRTMGRVSNKRFCTFYGNFIHHYYFVNLGGLAVAVPGELLGYWEAHQRFGKLDWKLLFKPAIELCEKGSYINSYLKDHINSKEAEIRAEPTLAEILINPETNATYKVIMKTLTKTTLKRRG